MKEHDMANSALDHPRVQAYLDRLEEATGSLPAAEADDVRDGIVEHLHVALTGVDPATPAGEAELRQVLDRLGDPLDLVPETGPAHAAATAPPPPDAGPADRSATENHWTLGLLVLATVTAPLWPFALPVWLMGLALVARAPWWTRGERVLGALTTGLGFPLIGLPLAGLLGAMGLSVGEQECETVGGSGPVDCVTGAAIVPHPAELGVGAVVALTVVGVGLVVAFVLGGRARRRAEEHATASERTVPGGVGRHPR